MVVGRDADVVSAQFGSKGMLGQSDGAAFQIVTDHLHDIIRHLLLLNIRHGPAHKVPADLYRTCLDLFQQRDQPLFTAVETGIQIFHMNSTPVIIQHIIVDFRKSFFPETDRLDREILHSSQILFIKTVIRLFFGSQPADKGFVLGS